MARKEMKMLPDKVSIGYVVNMLIHKPSPISHITINCIVESSKKRQLIDSVGINLKDE